MKKKDFGKRLAQLRKERGMTQDDLAASLRVSRSTITIPIISIFI